MRAGPAFDTHAYVKKPVAAGVPEAQAEVHAEALVETALAGLVTRDDLDVRLKEFESRMDARFRDMETRLKDLELRLTLRFGAMLAAAVAILAIVDKLF
jgi:hypothetical protein